MNILITGGNGQLGSELKLRSSEYPWNFHFCDIDTLDITSYEAINKLINTFRPNFIINCAGYTAVDKAEQEPDLANNINHLAVKNLRLLSEKYQIKLIHISTDYVFDGTKNTPYKETDITNPQSIYGLSKLKGENELINSSLSLIIRTSWLYSSFGNNFVKTILTHAKNKKELSVVYDQTGSPTYAADLADTILKIIENKNFISGIYHYANEGVCSWYDFATEIISIKNLKCKIIPIETWQYPLLAKRPAYSVLNKTKIKETYKIDIPYWKESLIKCLKIIK